MSPASSLLPSAALRLGFDPGSITRLRREPDDRNPLMGGTRTGVVPVDEEDTVVDGEWADERESGALYETGGGRYVEDTEWRLSSDEVELRDFGRRSSRWPEAHSFVGLSVESSLPWAPSKVWRRWVPKEDVEVGPGDGCPLNDRGGRRDFCDRRYVDCLAGALVAGGLAVDARVRVGAVVVVGESEELGPAARRGAIVVVGGSEAGGGADTGECADEEDVADR